MIDICVHGKRLRSFPSQKDIACCYHMFDRHSGVSSGKYESLNIGNFTGDQQAQVEENRRRVRMSIGVSALVSARQVHGNKVCCLATTVNTDIEIDGVDALVTDLTDVGLVIQQADCQAVLLFDPVKNVIAAVHCGWRGSVQHILKRTISVMIKRYGSTPGNLWAAISPSLGPCCAEFINYKKELPEYFHQFKLGTNHFDFWQISKYQLLGAGLVESYIETAGICTCCSSDYFSYRRACRFDGGVTGRNCSVIALKRV